jgi:hypothetical protein
VGAELELDHVVLVLHRGFVRDCLSPAGFG